MGYTYTIDVQAMLEDRTSQLRKLRSAAGEHYLASLVYGCAKFPCLAGQTNRVRSLAMQVNEYVAASPAFPVRFGRRILQIPYRGRVAAVRHLGSAPPGHGALRRLEDARGHGHDHRVAARAARD